MNAYRDQERFDGEITTIVSNNANFVKGRPGEPVLVSWDDATTLFHEFGHALHGLCSNVTYPSLSGTSVARDYVEFPSQLLEHWLSTPEVLNRFALHFQTGKPIPPELVAKIEQAKTFNQGFATVEYLASALVDMKLHLAGATPIDPDAFERDTLKALGMPDEIVMRHRTPQFGHVFAGDGYSAGYYSYLWSDTLTADACEAFTRPAGPTTRRWRSGSATRSSRSATPSTPPTPTGPSAAATPGSTRSCASAASRSRPRRRPTDRATSIGALVAWADRLWAVAGEPRLRSHLEHGVDADPRGPDRALPHGRLRPPLRAAVDGLRRMGRTARCSTSGTTETPR